VLNGLEAVTNSSSDAEPLDDIDEEKDSVSGNDIGSEPETDSDSGSDTLDDIDELIARKRQKLAELPSAPADVPAPAHEERQLRSLAKPASKPPPRRTMSPPRKMYKHSLAAMIRQKRKDAELDARINDLERSIIQADHDDAQTGDAQAGNADMELGLASAMDPNDADDESLKQAMKRIDVLEQEVRFDFFTTPSADVHARHDFPTASLPQNSWAKCMKDTSAREQVVLSDFAADMSSVVPLPAEVQEWMLGEILFESRDDLSHAYIEILDVCAQHDTTGPLFDMPMLLDCMERLGAKEDVIGNYAKANSCMLRTSSKAHSPTMPVGLQNFLLLLSAMSRTYVSIEPSVHPLWRLTQKTAYSPRSGKRAFTSCP